jgi:hypothetical protein
MPRTELAFDENFRIPGHHRRAQRGGHAAVAQNDPLAISGLLAIQGLGRTRATNIKLQ